MMRSSSCSGKNDFSRVISHFWMVLLAQASHFSVQDIKFQSKYSVDPIQDNTSSTCWIKLVNPKGNQPWIFTGRTDAEAETPVLWPPDAKIQLTEKYPDAGKDWRQKEKRAAEDEMVRQHHWLNGHEFEQTLGDSEREGSLACCSPRGHQESDTT